MEEVRAGSLPFGDHANIGRGRAQVKTAALIVEGGGVQAVGDVLGNGRVEGQRRHIRILWAIVAEAPPPTLSWPIGSCPRGVGSELSQGRYKLVIDAPTVPAQLRIAVGDDARSGTVEEVDDFEAVLGDRLAGLGAFDEEVGVFGDETFGSAGDGDHLVAPEVAAPGVMVGSGGKFGGDTDEALVFATPLPEGFINSRRR